MSKESTSQSMAAADELGHEHLGPEHFLIALLRIDGHAKTALNACGVTDASLLAEIRRVGPKANKPPPPMPMRWRFQNAAASQTMARAYGLAVGLGVDFRSEHVLLAILWDPESWATQILERLGGTPERVLEELGRLGVAIPKASPPKRRSWEAPVRLSRDEFERRTAELRAAGILYGFNYADEEMLLLVERPDAPEE
jgi:ATP-dependent Clp protease ATP-binding subunit ClpA